MKNIDSDLHLTGQSVYIDDVSVPDDCLFAQVYYAPVAHAKNLILDLKDARASEGVVCILTDQDIPGENQIGGIIPDEPLLGEHGEVHFWGQPQAIVVARSERLASLAVEKIKATFETLDAVICPKAAHQKKSYLIPPDTFERGSSQVWKDCEWIVEGEASSGGQEHLYLEPQGALAVWKEDGGLHVISSTQGPTAVQRSIAKVLNYPMHKIEVDVKRLGGGFGGKEDQATPWAVMASLVSWYTKSPAKLILNRHDDMRMTGKRHPYLYSYKIGMNKSGKILGWEVDFFQNGGAASDLSPAVISRSLFHAANSYFIPYVRATGYCCRTNLPPNTAFRGFGAPQGVFAIESALRHLSEKSGIRTEDIQRNNLLREGDEFHYGQVAKECYAQACWSQCFEKHDYPGRVSEVSKFNESHDHLKKGLSVIPICFGISFTKTEMNQASALVHLYQDGSLSIGTAAIEMGQGVNTKILQMAQKCLGVSAERVQILSTNTSRVANTSPTAASSGADLNARATEKACLELKGRLINFLSQNKGCAKEEILFERDQIDIKGRPESLSWEELAYDAWSSRIPLSTHQHYATPGLHFDLRTKKGSPFAYHVYGCAITEVTVDVVRGNYTIDQVDIVHDFGQSMNSLIDQGQVEGALMQGIGWMTLEDLRFAQDGRPMSDTLSTYKVPDIYCAPGVVNISAVEGSLNPQGSFVSKAVGEPPLMYGLGSFFALREAVKAASNGTYQAFESPMTPETVLMGIWGDTISDMLQVK